MPVVAKAKPRVAPRRARIISFAPRLRERMIRESLAEEEAAMRGVCSNLFCGCGTLSHVPPDLDMMSADYADLLAE